MITYTVAGPKDAVMKAASRLQAMHQTEGKIVIKYDNAALVPEQIKAGVQVVIIVKPEPI